MNLTNKAQCTESHGLVSCFLREKIYYTIEKSFFYSIIKHDTSPCVPNVALTYFHTPTYIQSQDIIICHFVTLPFITVHFQIFCKNYHDKLIETTGMKSKYTPGKKLGNTHFFQIYFLLD